MKKIFVMMVSLMAFTCLNVHAMSKKGEKDSIDCVMYRVTYNAKTVKDTTKLDTSGHYRYATDLMRLDIGKKVSKFYSYTYIQTLKYVENAMKTGVIDMRQMKGKMGNIKWTLFRNDPEGYTSVYDDVYSDHYRIKEPTQTPQWKIVSDSVKTILNYQCTMAVTDFKGRHWTAWYTEDIPMQEGPWKLIGLPGLIFSAHDSENQFIFEGVGLEKIDGKEGIMMDADAKKSEDITQEKFDKMKRTTSALQGMPGLSEVIVNGKKGSATSDPQLKAKLNKVLPYNPIER
jgi:GLPGLI family protein